MQLRPGFVPITKTHWEVSVNNAQSFRVKNGFARELLLLQQSAQNKSQPNWLCKVQIQVSKDLYQILVPMHHDQRYFKEERGRKKRKVKANFKGEGGMTSNRKVQRN